MNDLTKGDRVMIFPHYGTIEDIAWDGEVKVAIDGATDKPMWYPREAIVKVELSLVEQGGSDGEV